MKRKIIVSSKTLKFRNALRDVCKAKRKEMTNLIIQLLDIVDDYYQGNAIVSPSELLNHIGLDASYEDDLIHLYNSKSFMKKVQIILAIVLAYIIYIFKKAYDTRNKN
jgi:hypothetical protein